MADGSININSLPDEILLKIFSYLSVEDLGLNVQSVCIRWSHLCLDDLLWKDLLFSPMITVSEDDILSLLEKVPKLQSAELLGTTAEIIHKLAECCKNLRKLIVAEMDYQEAFEEAFHNLVRECISLEELTIAGEALDNAELAASVGQLANLRALCIIGTEYQAVRLNHIVDGCPSLQCLDMGVMNWFYSDLEYFLQQKNSTLLSLVIRYKSIEGAHVFPLLAMCGDGLRELILLDRLDGCEHIDGPTFAHMRKLSSLTLLRIGVPSGLTADVMSSIFVGGAMSQLLELQLYTGNDVNATVVNTICNNCPNLLRLGLLRCYHLCDDGLRNLYKCANLEELDLSSCSSLSDGVMEHVVRCTKLKSLVLENCNLTEKGLVHVLDLSELRNLDLSYCNFSGLSFQLFPLHLKNLRKLTLSCYDTSDTVALDTLSSEMPHLNLSM